MFDHVENDIEIRIESINIEINRLETDLIDRVEKMFQLFLNK